MSLSLNEGNKIILVVRDACATRENLAENFECHDNIIEVEGLKLYSKIAGGAAICNDVDLMCKATRFLDHARIGTAGALKPLIKLMYSEDTHYKRQAICAMRRLASNHDNRFIACKVY